MQCSWPEYNNSFLSKIPWWDVGWPGAYWSVHAARLLSSLVQHHVMSSTQLFTALLSTLQFLCSFWLLSCDVSWAWEEVIQMSQVNTFHPQVEACQVALCLIWPRLWWSQTTMTSFSKMLFACYLRNTFHLHQTSGFQFLWWLVFLSHLLGFFFGLVLISSYLVFLGNLISSHTIVIIPGSFLFTSIVI